MTQSSSISQTLLENSKISGVCLKNKSSQLSTIGHGLYIESLEGDRYIDLRLASEKPFWGHTHPLTIQHAFKRLSKLDYLNEFYPISKNDFDSQFSNYQSIKHSELESVTNSKNQKFLVELTESDYLKSCKSLQKFQLKLNEDFLKNNDVIMMEKNLMGLATSGINNLEFTSAIYNEQLSDIVLIHKKYHEQFSDKILEDSFYDHMSYYLDHYITNSGGKADTDKEIIQSYIKDNSLEAKLRYENRYFLLDDITLSKSDFLENGLLVDESNFIAQSLFLQLPLACTKDEILDSLSRLKSTVLR